MKHVAGHHAPAEIQVHEIVARRAGILNKTESGLLPAEANLAILLARGLSLAEAALLAGFARNGGLDFLLNLDRVESGASASGTSSVALAAGPAATSSTAAASIMTASAISRRAPLPLSRPAGRNSAVPLAAARN